MNESSARTRLIIRPETRPALPRHIKLRHDEGRGRWIILAPERVFNPDETAVAVLKLCDGHRTVREIASELAQQYAAPAEAILADIVPMLQDIADRGVIVG